MQAWSSTSLLAAFFHLPVMCRRDLQNASGGAMIFVHSWELSWKVCSCSCSFRT